MSTNSKLTAEVYDCLTEAGGKFYKTYHKQSPRKDNMNERLVRSYEDAF